MRFSRGRIRGRKSDNIVYLVGDASNCIRLTSLSLLEAGASAPDSSEDDGSDAVRSVLRRHGRGK
jgi:hypothetical protein